MKFTTVLLFGFCMVSLQAFGDTPKPAKLTDAELTAVSHAHAVNQMEITMGKRAKLVGTAPVKAYGEMLVKDHSEADKELAAFAKLHGTAKIPAEKAPATDAEKAEAKEQKDHMKHLTSLKGIDFDRMYLQMMIDGHDKELKKSDPFIALMTDSDLKAMFEKRKTSLQKHHDQAKDLQKNQPTAANP